MKNTNSVIRWYGPDSYEIYCDLESDKRATKIKAALPGYIYPLSHFIWAKLLKVHTWDNIIDIGANYGEFTLDALVYASSAKTKFISFEPSKSTFYFLQNTLKPFKSYVQVHNFGISSESKIRVFRDSPISSGGSRILEESAPKNSNVRHYPMRFETLNPWLEKSKNSLVKMDVEGHEIEILKAIDLSENINLCFFLEINQIDRNFLISAFPNLELYIFSKFRGKMVLNPKVMNLPKILNRYRDLYLQDAILIHSKFLVGKTSVESIRIKSLPRIKWLLSSKIDVFSMVGRIKN